MSLPLLKILGHSLASSSLSKYDKQAAWAVSCLAFYGSLRLGEILCHRELGFHSADSFLWADVNFAASDHVILRLKNTKSGKTECVDIFSNPSCSTCPVKSLRKLRSASAAQPSSPVFVWESGSNITPRDLNLLLPKLLEPHIGQTAHQLSGHSFRAAIPSLLASFPELSSSDEVMGWGRWKSSAYLIYTRLKSDQRRKVYNKILSLLSRRPRGSGTF